MKKRYILFVTVLSVLYMLGVCAAEGAESEKITFHKMSERVDTFRIGYKGFVSHEENRRGSSIGGKLAIQPVTVGKFDIGGYARFSNGNSKKTNDRGFQSRADWKIVGGGISTIYHHESGSRTGFELGILHQRTDVDAPERGYTSLQKEWQWEVRAKHLFTMNIFECDLRSEIGGEFINPFDVQFRDSNGRGAKNAYDNARISIWWRTDLHDFYLGDGQIRLTPTINLGLGYLWGKDSGYASAGPGLKFAWFEQEIIEVFVSSRWLFSGLDGRFIWGIEVKPYDIYLAFKASKIKAYE